MLGFAPLAASPLASAPSSAAVYSLAPATGTFALTGSTATLFTGTAPLALNAATGSFSLTGVAATPKANYKITGQGVFALTGSTAALDYGFLLSHATGAFAATGHTVVFSEGQGAPLATGAFALSMGTVLGKHSAKLNGVTGSYSHAGSVAATVARRINESSGAFALTGGQVFFGKTDDFPIPSGAYALAVTFDSVRWNHGLTLGTGSFAFTGSASDVRSNRRFPLPFDNYNLAGFASLAHDRALKVQGAFGLSGAVELGLGQTFPLSRGAYTAAAAGAGRYTRHGRANGSAFSVALSGAVFHAHISNIAGSSGAYALNGAAAAFKVSHQLIAAPGSFMIYLQPPAALYSGAQLFPEWEAWARDALSYVAVDGLYMED